ncbi:BMP family protein [Pseudorhodoplanes sp.]|uniref:BMP family protein n=1 Tax=Pseudorhodoplanes sp. TaxID=1934341 RepID=UPI002C232034|nr:BMP family protein [Pseudorhodoplanes sp.]HWV54575.1 BMP family protein [Pseudorhodoplanes sp.]
MRFRPSRRQVFGLAGGLACTMLAAPARAQPKPKIAALFAGSITDGGFMESGYRGLVAARDKLGVEIGWRDGVRPERELLATALRELARSGAALVIAHGGQNNEAARLVAPEFPETRFVVTQGNVTGDNLASYEVLQEDSAFLAGALAAWSTRTGVVGHMSGIRVVPGLKGRAAYAHGIAHANPQVRLLTNFSGNQDDNPLSKRIAAAMIADKADVIFTMLNAGRSGAIDACREGGARQIGNVRDWTTVMPDVFIASAIADSGIALLRAAEDLTAGTLKTNSVEKIGLARPDAVRLAMSPAVGDDIRKKIEALAADIKDGRVRVPTDWSGPEFQTPA